jgi:hypothetical protein
LLVFLGKYKLALRLPVGGASENRTAIRVRCVYLERSA